HAEAGPVGSPRWRRWAAAWSAAWGSLAFPMQCVVCGADGLAAPFCDGCRRGLGEATGRACGRCGLSLGPWESGEAGCSWCRGRALGFDGAVALGPYDGPIRYLCLQMKRLRGAWLAPWVADLLVEARGEALRGLDGALVAAVPLHWRRRWRRGYNQADELA